MNGLACRILLLCACSVSGAGCRTMAHQEVGVAVQQTVGTHVDGQWFYRTVYDSQARVDAIEVIYCPLEPGVEMVCRSGTLWRAGARPGRAELAVAPAGGAARPYAGAAAPAYATPPAPRSVPAAPAAGAVSCTRDVDCPRDGICENGVCVPGAGPAAVPQPAAASVPGTTGASGTGGGGPGASCTSDADCAAPLRCNPSHGFCTVPPE